MAPLLRLLADEDGAVRQKGLMALSCLVRHSQPAVQQFHEVYCRRSSAYVQQHCREI